MIKAIIASAAILLLSIGAYLFFVFDTVDAPQATKIESPSKTGQKSTAEVPVSKEFDKKKYSLEDPGSIWVIVNKKRPIPTSFIPSDLVVPSVKLRLGSNQEQMQIRKKISDDVRKLFDGASDDNITLVFGSGYRSATLQKTFYDQYVANSGKQAADTFSARPGHSEHQTGLSFDVTNESEKCHLETCFASTDEGQWLAKNAHLYGFIIRYPQDKDNVTGYQFEPWHLRFVGVELAKEIYSSKKTFEEFFDLAPAPTY